MAKNEIVVKESTGLAVAGDFMFGDVGAGFGLEGTDKDSFAIPFLVVVQKMSPIVDENDPAYNENAKVGMIYNTVSQKLYDGKVGLQIVPCAYRRSFIHWGSRDGGNAGFKGEFTPEAIEEMISEGKAIPSEGKLLKPLADGSVHEKKSDRYEDTRTHYVVYIDPETGEYVPAILALSSSQIKKSKMLMTVLGNRKIETPAGKRTPPTFANIVRLTTIGESNDKGSWSGIKMELEGLVQDKDLYIAAKELHGSVASGEARADFSKAAPESAESVAQDDKF